MPIWALNKGNLNNHNEMIKRKLQSITSAFSYQFKFKVWSQLSCNIWKSSSQEIKDTTNFNMAAHLNRKDEEMKKLLSHHLFKDFVFVSLTKICSKLTKNDQHVQHIVGDMCRLWCCCRVILKWMNVPFKIIYQHKIAFPLNGHSALSPSIFSSLWATASSVI